MNVKPVFPGRQILEIHRDPDTRCLIGGQRGGPHRLPLGVAELDFGWRLLSQQPHGRTAGNRSGHDEHFDSRTHLQISKATSRLHELRHVFPLELQTRPGTCSFNGSRVSAIVPRRAPRRRADSRLLGWGRSGVKDPRATARIESGCGTGGIRSCRRSRRRAMNCSPAHRWAGMRRAHCRRARRSTAGISAA